jgi:microsomal dipeptidase-like Zn-dependent dipeptidase
VTRRIGIALAALLLFCSAALFLGTRVESLLNRVEPVALPVPGEAARRLHAASLVADLHADSLLFGRDLLERSRVGHVDLPRLREGGVGLQFLTVVTKTPLGMNIEATDGERLDMLTLAGAVQLSPFLWRGLLGRALYQAECLDALVARSRGGLHPVRSRADLGALLARRAEEPGTVGVVLGIEGAHALEGDPARLGELFDAGFRMIGMAHFFDNEFTGSAHGLRKTGLTAKGRDLLRRMEAAGVLVDLAHLAPAAIDDTLALVTRPPVVSHGGVRGTCDNVRNLSDAHVRAIAARGGVIGIGYWETAVCGTDMAHVSAAIRHVVTLVGDEHVALGSDYDGATTVGFDTGALPSLTQQLLDDGLSEQSIGRILGGNVLRVLREVLPER